MRKFLSLIILIIIFAFTTLFSSVKGLERMILIQFSCDEEISDFEAEITICKSIPHIENNEIIYFENIFDSNRFINGFQDIFINRIGENMLISIDCCNLPVGFELANKTFFITSDVNCITFKIERKEEQVLRSFDEKSLNNLNTYDFCEDYSSNSDHAAMRDQIGPLQTTYSTPYFLRSGNFVVVYDRNDINGYSNALRTASELDNIYDFYDYYGYSEPFTYDDGYFYVYIDNGSNPVLDYNKGMTVNTSIYGNSYIIIDEELYAENDDYAFSFILSHEYFHASIYAESFSCGDNSQSSWFFEQAATAAQLMYFNYMNRESSFARNLIEYYNNQYETYSNESINTNYLCYSNFSFALFIIEDYGMDVLRDIFIESINQSYISIDYLEDYFNDYGTSISEVFGFYTMENTYGYDNYSCLNEYYRELFYFVSKIFYVPPTNPNTQQNYNDYLETFGSNYILIKQNPNYSAITTDIYVTIEIASPVQIDPYDVHIFRRRMDSLGDIDYGYISAPIFRNIVNSNYIYSITIPQYDFGNYSCEEMMYSIANGTNTDFDSVSVSITYN